MKTILGFLLILHIAASAVVLVADDDSEGKEISRKMRFVDYEIVDRGNLEITIERLPVSFVMARCAYLNESSYVAYALAVFPLAIGCAHRPPSANRCIVVLGWGTGPGTFEHELRHCEGWAHDRCSNPKVCVPFKQ